MYQRSSKRFVQDKAERNLNPESVLQNSIEVIASSSSEEEDFYHFKHSKQVKESESYYYIYLMHSLCLITLSVFIYSSPSEYHILDPIVSVLLSALILYKNLNIPRDSISLLLLRVNEEVLIREMKEAIKDKIS